MAKKRKRPKAKPRPKLTARQKKFVRLKVEGYSGKGAAVEAGYSENSAAQMAWELGQMEHVREYTRQLLERCEISSLEVRHKIMLVLLAILDSSSAEDRDKIAACDKLARLHGMYSENRNVNINGGAQVSILLPNNSRNPELPEHQGGGKVTQLGPGGEDEERD